MVGISGIGLYAEPANPRRVKELRVNSEKTVPGAASELPVDRAKLRSEALILAKASEQQDQINAERIEQIRQSLEQGAYRVQEVLIQVAARVAKFVQ